MKKYFQCCDECESSEEENDLYKIVKGSDKGKILCSDCLDEWKDSQLEDYYEDYEDEDKSQGEKASKGEQK